MRRKSKHMRICGNSQPTVLKLPKPIDAVCSNDLSANGTDCVEAIRDILLNGDSLVDTPRVRRGVQELEPGMTSIYSVPDYDEDWKCQNSQVSHLEVAAATPAIWGAKDDGSVAGKPCQP
ncbi:uncharacterized protein Z518_05494 [Rhinocladiella mackenziei CBS 650.93]|uniref:Rhinocladiella mackenziei CBS 650.93 unplaced genomic scaffold supercont1.4, whole genome shotgun sequence n=1 Tax=Rhinocladiella mackenziei CBS 650.93 TaxID=1442369 RepID=A0A0D2IFN3_9EURO|nr:uncharacterized protein Z518_05494 [Rhinocladiella mackenziei CBS 650.93]KIX04624.1 hypothetical protein Z518_05494 [Rhinocladiella mackenziei CBS 650.93]